MKIDLVEITNFRKLKCCQIDFDEKKTLLVGANNSGKTTAMIALRKFLISPKSLNLRDISIGNWAAMDQIGQCWEDQTEPETKLRDLLPTLDVWLDVPLSQIHHVVHILPDVDWAGGIIGVRLQFDIEGLDSLKSSYLDERLEAKKIEAQAPAGQPLSITPRNLVEFLEKNLSKYLVLRSFSLDPDKLANPNGQGTASPQSLDDDILELDSNPFQELIFIREIPAMRDFSTGSSSPSVEDDRNSKSDRVVRTLSDHVRSYYDSHVDQTDDFNEDDIKAFGAMQSAEKAFDKRLQTGFSMVFDELKHLGIPGVNNPSISINTRFKSIDGLNHDSAVQYKVSEPEAGQEERFLPESYAGLGYQNLIAMVFLLMRFRQDWIEPKSTRTEEASVAPLQLILIEEPEAHLHAQIQQVFIKKAYDILRNHPDLEGSDHFNTQLFVSTHSSHVTHEVDFANLRYFRRLPAEGKGHPPTSSVVNLSNIFGDDDKTLRFVTRYIKATDCDLFFADAAIFIEGQAERILVPHFIRHHFDELWRRYISLIDLGGSNAPRFRPLVKALGLTSLVITDLDAAIPTEVETAAGGKTTRNKKAKAALEAGQVTTNPTLKKWYPELTTIDDLVALADDKHSARVDDEYDLYVAYQKSVPDPTKADGSTLIARTFEDALVYANFDVLADLSGSSTTNKIAELILSGISGEALETELFEIVDRAEKAVFAVECLVDIEDGAELVPPPYIRSGLEWLQRQLSDVDSGALNLEVPTDGK
jgi:predicted ATP-dependent endonuclease of OLD family